MAKLSMEDKMRARFHEATAERDALDAQAKPLREKYDAISAEITEITEKRLKPVAEKKREIEQGMYDLNMEIGKISRFLRVGNFGATGEAPEDKN